MIMKKQKKMILGVCICVVFASVVFFVPAILQAGSLEPSGAPAPTMKTLDQIPPTWSEKITTGRFVDALGGVAVLDRETGLVWEKSPSTSKSIWTSAIYHCANLYVGDRKGWHLPTAEQLASLVDTSVGGNTKLPSGHPFNNVQVDDAYWSATTYDGDNTLAWGVSFLNSILGYSEKATNLYVWCARGGQSYDGY
jgi:hypothetical protein